MTPEALRGLVAQVPHRHLHWGIADTSEPAPLHASELRHIARAVPARRAEFAAGRLAARRALAALGRPDTAIPASADRLPQWPEGILGSISHTGELAVAVLARRSQTKAIGVDIEPDAPLPADLIPEICTAQDDAQNARAVFSAKEALFKAQYPHTLAMFGFHALAVDLKKGTAHVTDHPDSDAIAQQWRAMLWPVSQWRGAGLILSLSHFPGS